MSSIDVNAIHRRDQRVVLVGLASITILSWAYIIYLAVPMATMHEVVMPQSQAWGVVDLVLTLLMWTVMMVAMMLPSASPMILTYTTVHRRRLARGDTVVPTAVFLAGYVMVWGALSLAATLAQWGLHQTALLSPMMVSTSPLLGGLLLIVAGTYQWSRLKYDCLSKCRAPIGFLLAEWREGTRGTLVMGMRHGMFCTGCCWALMALLFVGGVMNLLWVATIAGFVLVEKIAPQKMQVGRVAGLGLMAWGGWLLLDGIL